MGADWQEVYAAHDARLVALLAAVVGSRTEAEEVVQEAFVRALGLTGRRPVPDDPESWLYRVAVNLARSRWRRARVGRRIAPRLVRDEAVGPTQAGVDSRVVLLAALRRLPFEQREVLALHYLADMSVSDIAVRTSCPVGTFKARLSRGREALARLLADDSVRGGQRGG